MRSPDLVHRNPYVGPRPLQAGEPLFGRAREAAELIDLLMAERIVLFYSPSGAGKTSLIRASVIPAFQKNGFHVLPVIRMGVAPPLADPASSTQANRFVLSAILCLSRSEPPAIAQNRPPAELATLGLEDYLNSRQADPRSPDYELLIFDQFEEVLTVDPYDLAARVAFFDQLGAALRDRRRWALFAMREDFVAGLDPFLHRLPTRLKTTYRLDLLGAGAAREAVQGPARAAGVVFREEAIARLVDDLRRVRVQQPDGDSSFQMGPFVEPVQLQVVCRHLWAALPPGTTEINVERVADVTGDVDSALAQYYANQVRSIVTRYDVSERTVREWVEALVTEQGIRGQVLQAPRETRGLDNRVILALIGTHLVRAENRRGDTWFELAHDRLIEPIRRDNRAWRASHDSRLRRLMLRSTLVVVMLVVGLVVLMAALYFAWRGRQ